MDLFAFSQLFPLPQEFVVWFICKNFLSFSSLLRRLYDYYEATVETMDAKISLINEALQELPMEYHVLLLEEHVQACIDASTLSGDTAYDEKAIQSLCKIVDMGWGSYTQNRKSVK